MRNMSDIPEERLSLANTIHLFVLGTRNGVFVKY